jgi:hypothetical protein
MHWKLYLPIARHSINILWLLGLGGGVGFFSGLFGVGGGFLMTPLLIMIGIAPTVAAASDSNQIVAATASGTFAHYRMGNVDIKMGVFLLAGAFVGGNIGVEIIKILRHLGSAAFFIKVTYVVMLGGVGSYMFVESLQSLRRAPGEEDTTHAVSKPPLYVRLGSALPWPMHFEKSDVVISPLMPLAVGLFVGTIAAIMGLGGGFVMVPLMFYVLRMPMHLVVGTNLFQEAFLCSNVTIMQAATNHVVDLELALILLVASSVGAQFGARFSARLRAEQLRILLAIVILLVMLKIFLGLILPPEFMLDVKGGG